MKIIVVAVAAVILVAVGLSCSDSETFTIQVKTSFEDYQEAKIYVNGQFYGQITRVSSIEQPNQLVDLGVVPAEGLKHVSVVLSSGKELIFEIPASHDIDYDKSFVLGVSGFDCVYHMFYFTKDFASNFVYAKSNVKSQRCRPYVPNFDTKEVLKTSY